MSTPAGQVERTVRQLDDDIQSIYEMLASIEVTQRRHGDRLEDIDGRLTDLEGSARGNRWSAHRDGRKLDHILALLHG